MVEVAEKIRDFLEKKKALASLATLMPDGTPQVTPVWFEWKNGHAYFNTAKGRVKERNLKVGSPVAMSIQEIGVPNVYVQVRGKISRVTEEGAYEHIRELAKKYQDRPYKPLNEDEVRVIYEIEPTSVTGWGLKDRE